LKNPSSSPTSDTLSPEEPKTIFNQDNADDVPILDIS